MQKNILRKAEEVVIKYNRYLEEIGVERDSFPFKIEDDRYIEDPETHISSAETWSMDYVLNMVIYSYLRAFKDKGAKYGHPASLTHEKWIEILDEMIEGYKIAIIDDMPSHRKLKKMKKAKALFKKWFNHLWW